MTDEPNNPIDRTCDAPEDALPDPDLGQATPPEEPTVSSDSDAPADALPENSATDLPVEPPASEGEALQMSGEEEPAPTETVQPETAEAPPREPPASESSPQEPLQAAAGQAPPGEETPAETPPDEPPATQAEQPPEAEISEARIPETEPEEADQAKPEEADQAESQETEQAKLEEAKQAEPEETEQAKTEEAEQAEPKETEPETTTVAEQPEEEEKKSENMNWYILKVQSNREDSIREGLQRRVAIAGLDYYFGDVIVPTEKVTEFKGGKRRVVKRKLYPGYLVVQMEITDDTWFLVRETPGIGDFTGAAGHPSPMLPHEVSRIVAKQEEKHDETPKLKISFNIGDQVKINEGTFENFEGAVESLDEANGQVTVMINIFGRSTPVTLEYWQIESL